MMLLAGGSALLPLGSGKGRRAKSDAWRLASVVALALAGALYLYPECVPIYAAHARTQRALLAGCSAAGRTSLQLAAAALVAIALTLPCSDGAMDVLFRQIHSAVTRSERLVRLLPALSHPARPLRSFIAAYKSGQIPHERALAGGALRADRSHKRPLRPLLPSAPARVRAWRSASFGGSSCWRAWWRCCSPAPCARFSYRSAARGLDDTQAGSRLASWPCQRRCRSW